MEKLHSYQLDKKTMRVQNYTLLKQIYCEAVHLLNPVLGLIEKAVELYGSVKVLRMHDAAIKTNIAK